MELRMGARRSLREPQPEPSGRSDTGRGDHNRHLDSFVRGRLTAVFNTCVTSDLSTWKKERIGPPIENTKKGRQNRQPFAERIFRK